MLTQRDDGHRPLHGMGPTESEAASAASTAEPLMSAAGAIVVRIGVAQSLVRQVSLHSTRPAALSRLFVGRRPNQVAPFAARLFSLCGTAQAVAALNACEAALAQPLSPARQVARRLLVAGEALEQTVLRLLVDWPRLIPQQPDLTHVLELRRLLAHWPQLIHGEQPWYQLGGVAVRCQDDGALVERVERVARSLRQMLDLTPGELPDTPAQVIHWARSGQGTLARVLRHVLTEGLNDWGRCDVLCLETAHHAWLHRRTLDSDDSAAAFCQRPHLADGQVAETGALARHQAHPLIAALRQDYGNGLLTRLLAQVVDLLALSAETVQLAHDLEVARDDPTAPPATASGRGSALVETARGSLLHGVWIEDGQVVDYRILAPTEWNFHPHGALVAGLKDTEVSDLARLERAARWLVAALDPCVDCRIEVVAEDQADA